MRITRRPKLPNSQTAEDRAIWETIRAELSESRRQKRLKYGLSRRILLDRVKIPNSRQRLAHKALVDASS